MTVMHIIWESCDKLIVWYASAACVCAQEREREREREGEGEGEREREGVCLRKGSYFASCFHREKKSADPMTVSSINLLMKTGTLSTNWWGLPPTL